MEDNKQSYQHISEQAIANILHEAQFDKEMSRLYGKVGKIVTMKEVPLFSDYTKIPSLYEHFSLSHKKGVQTRRVFLFAVLLLFCPMKLVGDKISKNLRKILSSTVGETGENLSYDFTLLKFNFEHYAGFRDEACRVINDFYGMLKG